MSINIFQGMRRIIYVIYALSTLGVLSSYSNSILQAIAYSFVTFICLFSSFFIIGWIIRGFVGIPIDRDFRDDSEGLKSGKDNTVLFLQRCIKTFKEKRALKTESKQIQIPEEVPAEPLIKNSKISNIRGGILLAIIFISARFGGIIGGAIGGAVGAHITSLLSSKISKAKKMTYSILSLLSGALIYLVLISVINILWPTFYTGQRDLKPWERYQAQQPIDVPVQKKAPSKSGALTFDDLIPHPKTEGTGNIYDQFDEAKPKPE